MQPNKNNYNNNNINNNDENNAFAQSDYDIDFLRGLKPLNPALQRIRIKEKIRYTDRWREGEQEAVLQQEIASWLAALQALD